MPYAATLRTSTFLAILAAVPLAVGQTPAAETRTLRILAHDYFSIDPAVLALFETEHGARVVLVEGGDANQAADRAIARAGAPEADLLFGFDNLTYRRLLAAGALAEYAADRRDLIPADIRAQFGDTLAVTPIDFGYVTLNWDGASGGEPPASYEELLDPAWRGKLVVEDPRASSPGLQFLLSTIAYFEEAGGMTWQDWWRGLAANEVHVAADWGEAYTERFTYRGGDRPLVVSYTTSPAAEVHFSNGALTEPPTENVILGPLFRQVEAVAVLAGAAEPDLAGAFIDFMLTDDYQALIPSEDHVYPVIAQSDLPEWWKWADVAVEPATLEVDQATIDAWVAEWAAIMDP
ncbi:MAG: thiamine ABC transporter substrate-binding protein [Bauldia sp.]|nr:thiamine ABC transporter substrate-binding protein [Bauldia sp.]